MVTDTAVNSISKKIIGVCPDTYEGFGKYNNYDSRNLMKKILSAERNNFQKLDENSLTEILDKIKNIFQQKNIATVERSVTDVDCSDISTLLSNYFAKERLAELENNPELHSWVKQGLEPKIHKEKEDACKFCGNQISNERWDQLKNYFHETTNKIDQKIKAIEEYKQSLEENIAFPEKKKFSERHMSSYQSAKESFLQERERQKLNAERIIRILNSKDSQEKLPIEKLSMNFYFDNINSVIETNNRERNEETIKNVDNLTVQFEEATIANFLPKYDEQNKKISNINEKFGHADEMESNIANNKNEILRLTKTLEEPNLFCQDFNIGIKNYLGHEDFSLDSSNDKTKYILLRKNKPSTIESLSEGEKTAFALLYFLFSLKKRGFLIKNSVIVIDDPISSLDSIHLHTAFAFIKHKITKAKQIFILTHNLNFAQRIIQWFNYEKNQFTSSSKNVASQFFILKKNRLKEKTLFIIESMPPSIRHHCSLMCSLFKELYILKNSDGVEMSTIRYINAPNTLRQFIEIYVSIWQPTKRASPENLIQIWKNLLPPERISAIVDICNRYSHGSPMNDVEDELEILFHNEKELLKLVFKAIQDHNEKFYCALEESVK